MFGALKRGFRSIASLILVRNVVGELQPERTLAASRGFLAAARLSCFLQLSDADQLIYWSSNVAYSRYSQLLVGTANWEGTRCPFPKNLISTPRCYKTSPSIPSSFTAGPPDHVLWPVCVRDWPLFRAGRVGSRSLDVSIYRHSGGSGRRTLGALNVSMVGGTRVPSSTSSHSTGNVITETTTSSVKHHQFPRWQNVWM